MLTSNKVEDYGMDSLILKGKSSVVVEISKLNVKDVSTQFLAFINQISNVLVNRRVVSSGEWYS